MLVGYRVAFQSVRHHIINILYEHDIGVNLVKILNECAMTARTEQQRAVIIAERCVVRVHSHCIGARFLLRESDVVLHSETLLILACLLGNLCLE